MAMGVKYYRAAEDLKEGDYVLADENLLRKAADKKFALGAVSEDVAEGKKIAAAKIYSAWKVDSEPELAATEEEESTIGCPGCGLTQDKHAPDCPAGGSKPSDLYIPPVRGDTVLKTRSDLPLGEQKTTGEDHRWDLSATEEQPAKLTPEKNGTYWWDFRKKKWTEPNE